MRFHGASSGVRLYSILAAMMLAAEVARGQDPPSRELRIAPLGNALTVDGVLSELDWGAADVATDFRQADPIEGALPTGVTRVRALAGPKALVIGIECDDPDAAGIVSFSKQRDAELESEDHVRIVLGTFLDGRSGYLFAVNPGGARFDALIEPGGEDNSNWDGIWEAATRRTSRGWTVEISIPIDSLSFNPDLREWPFNGLPSRCTTSSSTTARGSQVDRCSVCSTSSARPWRPI